jgi:hypothetical protein
VSARFRQVLDFIRCLNPGATVRHWQVIEISDKLSFAASHVSNLQQKWAESGVFPRGLPAESAEFAS